MDDKEKKRLIFLRGQCKATITRQEKFISESNNITYEDLEVRKTMLVSTFEKYTQYDNELKLAGECNIEEGVEDRVLLLEAKINRLIKEKQTSLEMKSSHAEDYKAKLPALDIPVFNGKDIAAYRPFIEMFEAVVDNDKRIPNIQKLCFLKKYLRDEPLQLIDNLPIVGDSYVSALHLLRKRYENSALLVNNHVCTLLDLPSLSRGTASQLRELVAKVRQHITALKNLEQPVQHWDAILSTIILRKLDAFTARLYHSDRDTTQIPTVDSILNFLDKRSASLEASPCSSEKFKYTSEKNKPKGSVSLVSSSTENSTKQCIKCSQFHKLYKCPQFTAMSNKERLQYVENNSLCKLCLAQHPKKCRYTFKCGECQANHNTLIHVEGRQAKTEQENVHSKAVSLHSFQSINATVLLPTAKVLVADANGNKFVVRALLDSGSQNSFCTAALANKLKLPTFNLNKRIITLGGNQDDCKKGIQLTIFSRVQTYSMNITCSIIERITAQLPQITFNLKNFYIPKCVALADDEFNVTGEVSLLLAADIFFRILLDGKVEGDPGDPVLINTRLGYIVSAGGHTTTIMNTALTMHTVGISNSDLDNQIKRFWDTERVPEVFQEALPEHEYSLKVFEESVTLTDNCFQVKYPLKVSLQNIDSSNSYAISLQRLNNLQKRFKNDPAYYIMYKNFIQEYLDLGHAKIIDLKSCDSQDQPLFFLPHHGVLKMERQTNKLRVVFDGSAKTKGGHSLNNILCNGPVLQRTLFEILILFRTYKYTIQCDIRHMYRNVYIHPEHRSMQNILWKENNTIQCLQLQTVTYGLTSSAFLATACLIELAKRYQAEFPLASKAIIECSYIDDVQTGSDTLEAVISLTSELRELMKKGGFELHKFSSNTSQVLQNIPKEKICQGYKEIDHDKSVHKILGIAYDPLTDVFKVSGRVLANEPNSNKTECFEYSK